MGRFCGACVVLWQGESGSGASLGARDGSGDLGLGLSGGPGFGDLGLSRRAGALSDRLVSWSCGLAPCGLAWCGGGAACAGAASVQGRWKVRWRCFVMARGLFWRWLGL